MVKQEVAPETTETPGTSETTETVAAETTETEAADTAEGGEEPATEEAGSEAKVENQIPYARFKKINDERKALLEENARLKASAPKPSEPVADPKSKLTGKLKVAPAGLNEMEQMEWYIANGVELHAPRVVETFMQEKFGMSLDAASAILAQSGQMTHETIVTRFEAACKDRGLDPRNEALRDSIGFIMDKNKFTRFDDAFNALYGETKAAPAAPKRRPNGAEVGGVQGSGLSKVSALPFTTAEATKLAAEGKRIGTPTVTEILAARQEKTARR